jgi:pantetheine-phosphate adenylyltransferase
MPPATESKANRGHVASRDVAVYTGMFDPITLGHMDVIERAASLFRRVIVGVGTNADKRALFSTEERVALVRECVAGIARVVVKEFEGLAVRFVRSEGAAVIVRGVRSAADVEYELTMARANRVLDATVETVLLPASEGLSHISSGLIRQVAREASREELGKFVPTPVIDPLLMKLQKDVPR